MAFPGGAMKMRETWYRCAEREVKEETDLTVFAQPFSKERPEFWVSDNPYLSGKYHYVTIWIHAKLAPGQDPTPKLMEPNKCEGWNWMSLDVLRDRLPYGAIRGGQHPALEWIPYHRLRRNRKKLDL
jgi:8-oxo-dGTP diphosphatase